MIDDSCIHCGTQVDFSSGSTCEHGPIHFACRAAIFDGRALESKSQHDPEIPNSSSTDAKTNDKDYPRSAGILGGVLSFIGTFLLVLAVIFWLIGDMLGHPLPSLPVVVALVGGAMLFAGRKIMSGNAEARAGGAVGGTAFGGIVAAAIAAAHIALVAFIVAIAPLAIVIFLIYKAFF